VHFPKTILNIMYIHVLPIFLIQRSKLNVDCSMFNLSCSHNVTCYDVTLRPPLKDLKLEDWEA